MPITTSDALALTLIYVMVVGMVLIREDDDPPGWESVSPWGTFIMRHASRRSPHA